MAANQYKKPLERKRKKLKATENSAWMVIMLSLGTLLVELLFSWWYPYDLLSIARDLPDSLQMLAIALNLVVITAFLTSTAVIIVSRVRIHLIDSRIKQLDENPPRS